MAFKDLLVMLDSGPTAEHRVELAMELANRMSAHLIGLYVTTVPGLPGRFGTYDVTLFGSPEAKEKTQRQADAARQAFDAAAARHGVATEWRFAGGDPSYDAALHGRYADLIILGQINLEDPDAEVGKPRPEQVVLAAGRPILIIPYVGHFETVGRRVLIGWNASREATRAVNDVLPLLVGAQSVTVLAIDPRSAPAYHGELPAADIALHLARHGVKAVVEQTASTGIDAGNILLSRAAEVDADLLVIGAYGHSRIQELVLGGVTRTILESMTLPVVMSH